MAEDLVKPTDFSATEAALGYLYQVRLALLLSLRRLSEDFSFSVFLETLDDVVFETTNSAKELLQLKHHRERAANLTDGSSDLWKTLRVWMEGRASQQIPEDAQLFLLTTSAVGKDSAASYLLAQARDEARATQQLGQTATTSQNKSNGKAYQLYRQLTETERLALVKSIVVLPQAPSIVDVSDELRVVARLSVRKEHLDSLLVRLEGWWYDRALRQMVDPDTPPILSNEIEAQFNDLRDQFRLDDLPVDQDILDSEVNAAAYDNAVFVHQVKLAGVGNRRVLAAIRDYYRAFEQRSRWIREDLLLVGELDKYEKLLREEWELEFDRVADAHGKDAADDAKRTAAQEVLAWVERSFFPIRTRVSHPSMSRGSLHILSNQLQIGWHPDFVDRLSYLLADEAAS